MPDLHVSFPAVPRQGEPRVVIIGGGITGLTAGYRLREAARAAGVALSCTIIEREARPGGKIITERPEDGWVVEGGPDSFVMRKLWAVELVRELGLGEELIGTEPSRYSTYVLRRGRPIPLPAGLGLIAPTRWLPFLRSPLFSVRGKLRMAMELWIAARRDDADESLASFVRRRFGREALGRLGEPLLAAIHNGVAEEQSLLATFPNLREMERTQGSVIRAARRQAALAKRRGTSEPAFATLREGMGTLIDALVARLGDALITGSGVAALERQADSAGYRVRLDDGTLLHADAVIVTTPAYTAAELVNGFAGELASALAGIRYVSTGTVTLAYPRGAAREPLEGFGVVIPRGEGRRINGCTITSRKFAHRAPEGHRLVRAFVGGTHRAELLGLPDGELVDVVREELSTVLGITTSPLWSRVYRWWDAHPQYTLGHLERVDRMTTLCPPGLILSGSAYRGVGIPDCVREAQVAADRALKHLYPSGVVRA
jgi:oxygen-dependent protoporphyrinogen oxidase